MKASSSSFCNEMSRLSFDFYWSVDAVVRPVDDILNALDDLGRSSQEQAGHAYKTLTELMSKGADEFVVSAAHHEAYSATQRIATYYGAVDALPRTLLVALVSQMECLQGTLIGWMLKVKPDLVREDRRGEITFEQLLSYASIEEAKNDQIERFVRKRTSGGPEADIRWFTRHLNVAIEEMPCFKVYLEVNDRRNRFVHHNGLVSPAHLEQRKARGMSTHGMKTGEIIPCDSSYLREAQRAIVQLGVVLTQLVWRKFLPGEGADSGQATFTLATLQKDLIYNREYDLGAFIGEFYRTKIAESDESGSDYSIFVNECSALRQLGKMEESRRVFDAFVQGEGKSLAGRSHTAAFIEAYLNDKKDQAMNHMVTLIETRPNEKVSLSIFPAVAVEVFGDVDFQKRYKQVTGNNLVSDVESLIGTSGGIDKGLRNE